MGLLHQLSAHLKTAMFNRFSAMLVTLVVSGITHPLYAQDRAQSLADIRQDLSVLYVEIQSLNQELSTKTGANLLARSGNTRERLDALEGHLAELTGKVEQLDFRINQIVRDGTNRIGDLEFRLVELEGGDVSTLAQTTTLGGVALEGLETPSDFSEVSTDSQTQFALSEKQDFDAAGAALENGEFAEAVRMYSRFIDHYPASPLTADAQFQLAEALRGNDDPKGAARAYLKSFSGEPTGPRAADALFRLGEALGELGQVAESCATLGEVIRRFPDAPASLDARQRQRDYGCQ